MNPNRDYLRAKAMQHMDAYAKHMKAHALAMIAPDADPSIALRHKQTAGDHLDIAGAILHRAGTATKSASNRTAFNSGSSIGSYVGDMLNDATGEAKAASKRARSSYAHGDESHTSVYRDTYGHKHLKAGDHIDAYLAHKKAAALAELGGFKERATYHNDTAKRHATDAGEWVRLATENRHADSGNESPDCIPVKSFNRETIGFTFVNRFARH